MDGRQRRQNHKRAEGFSYKLIQLSSVTSLASTNTTSGVLPLLWLGTLPGRSSKRPRFGGRTDSLRFTLDNAFRVLFSDSLGFWPPSESEFIVSEQSSEQASRTDVLGQSVRREYFSPYQDLNDIGQVRRTDPDEDGETMKDRTSIRAFLPNFEGDPGLCELDGTITAITGRHGFVGNGDHSAATSTTDDNSLNGVFPSSRNVAGQLPQLVLGSAGMKLSS